MVWLDSSRDIHYGWSSAGPIPRPGRWMGTPPVGLTYRTLLYEYIYTASINRLRTNVRVINCDFSETGVFLFYQLLAVIRHRTRTLAVGIDTTHSPLRSFNHTTASGENQIKLQETVYIFSLKGET